MTALRSDERPAASQAGTAGAGDELLANGDFSARSARPGWPSVEGGREVLPNWWLLDGEKEPGSVRPVSGLLRLQGSPNTRIVQVLPRVARRVVLAATVRVRSGRALCGAFCGSRPGRTPIVLTPRDGTGPDGFVTVTQELEGPVDQVVIATGERGTVVDIAEVSLRAASREEPSAPSGDGPASSSRPQRVSDTSQAADAHLSARSVSIDDDLPLPGVKRLDRVTVLDYGTFNDISEEVGESLEDLGVLTYTGPGYSVDKDKLLMLTRTLLPDSAKPSLRAVARVGGEVSPLLTDATSLPSDGGDPAQIASTGRNLDVVERRRLMNEPDDVEVERRRTASYLEAHANEQSGPLPAAGAAAITVPVPGVGASVREVSLPLVPGQAAQPRFALVESWEVRSYLGDIGLGRTVKVMSLFPGERCQITVQTWRNDSSTREDASSIFDSCDTAAETRFTTAVANETGSAFQDQGGWSLSVGAKVGAGADIGIVSGQASLETGFAANHQEASQKFAKAVTQAASEHANQVNNSRRQGVEHADTTTTASGAATTTVRELSNTNLRRVLNFLFRELNQAYDTYVVLRDIKVAFFNGRMGSADVVGLGDLRRLVAAYVPQASQDEAARLVLGLCVQRFDTAGQSVAVLQHGSASAGVYTWADAQVDATGALDYSGDPLSPDVRWRFKPGALGTDTALRPVEGLVTAVDQVTLRTDNVLVEALLGENDALDPYATSLQEIDLKARAADVDWREADTRRTTDALDLVAAAADKVDAWTKIFPDRPDIEVVPATAIAQTP